MEVDVQEVYRALASSLVRRLVGRFVPLSLF